MRKIKHIVRTIPVIGPILVRIYVWFAERRFSQSASYWENRYKYGRHSGDGSYGELAEFKAKVLNALVDEYAINTVIEFGCGDGNQLTLANYPRYLGLDVSATAIEICRNKFRGDSKKTFCLIEDYDNKKADVTLSLDVIFHLVEDEIFDHYMRALFAGSLKLVVVYASDTDDQESPKLPHVRHRKFTRWVQANQPRWSLKEVINNEIPFDRTSGTGSPSNFYIYEMFGP